jgi:hypothetical protein
MARDSSRRKGVSLAKGPVAILGLLGVAYGISALIFGSHGFTLHIPHGAVHGKKWIGLEVNGWSDLLFIAAGLLLLFSAPLHWGAKSMSLLVGLVMIAAAIVAAIRGNGVFGIFAADHITELIWAAAGVLLLVLAFLPRVGGGSDDEERPRSEVRTRRVVRREPQTATPSEPVQEPAPTAGARRTTTDNHESR